jgi:hypothetical protein
MCVYFQGLFKFKGTARNYIDIFFYKTFFNKVKKHCIKN